MRAQAVLLSALMAASCAGPPGDMVVGGADSAEGADHAMMDGIAATLEVKVQSELVRLLLHVTNDGDEAIEFTFPSSQRYDFVVESEMGEPVWRWSDGMMFAQVITEVTLTPGETWEFEAEWEPGNRTGRFQVVGEVTASEHDVRQRMTFDLP